MIEFIFKLNLVSLFSTINFCYIIFVYSSLYYGILFLFSVSFFFQFFSSLIQIIIIVIVFVIVSFLLVQPYNHTYQPSSIRLLYKIIKNIFIHIKNYFYYYRLFVTKCWKHLFGSNLYNFLIRGESDTSYFL